MRRTRIVPAALLGTVVIFEAFGYAQRLSSPNDGARVHDIVEARARDLDARFVDALISRYRDTLVLAEEESRAGHDPELRRLATSLLETRRRDLAHLMAIRTAEKTVPATGAVR
jgi:uncharacterized protein (DUF305 family)